MPVSKTDVATLQRDFFGRDPLAGDTAEWPDCEPLIDHILNDEGSEVAKQLTYSLACRKSERALRAVSGLDSKESFVRGASAIACARYDAVGARDTLSNRPQLGKIESVAMLLPLRADGYQLRERIH